MKATPWLHRLLEYMAEACCWSTCVVGEIPRDGILYELGVEFVDAVKMDDRTKALTVYYKIKRRASELARHIVQPAAMPVAPQRGFRRARSTCRTPR